MNIRIERGKSKCKQSWKGMKCRIGMAVPWWYNREENTIWIPEEEKSIWISVDWNTVWMLEEKELFDCRAPLTA